jgi:hypothetical protein
MIETEAYYLAETRCFAPGHELDDWCQAERAVDERLSASLSAIESSLRSATALLER